MATIPSAHFTATPMFMQSLPGEPEINYSADEFGAGLLQAIWASPGIITGTSFHVEQAPTVGWSIRVRSGRAMVGNYLVTSDTNYVIDVSALNTAPIGTRYHRVFLVVQDKNKGGDGYYAQIKVVEDFGAKAATPEAAAVLLLGVFTISPGQTNIQDAQISAKPRNASWGSDFVDLAASLTSTVVSADKVLTCAAARARYGGGRVWLSGGLRLSASTTARFPAADTKLGELPFYLRPQYSVFLTASASTSGNGSGDLYYRLRIDPDGTMTATVPDGSTPQYLFLDGVSYEVD